MPFICQTFGINSLLERHEAYFTLPVLDIPKLYIAAVLKSYGAVAVILLSHVAAACVFGSLYGNC